MGDLVRKASVVWMSSLVDLCCIISSIGKQYPFRATAAMIASRMFSNSSLIQLAALDDMVAVLALNQAGNFAFLQSLGSVDQNSSTI